MTSRATLWAMASRTHARTRSFLFIVMLAAVVVLGACSESSSTNTPAAGNGQVPEATLGPPPNSMPPGVTPLCASVTRSMVAKIVGPLHGSVPASEYRGTLFAVVLNASLNDCQSHKEWLDAAASAAHGYRSLLDVVFNNACEAAKGNTTTAGSGVSGGTGVVRPAPLPQSCRA